MGIDKEKNFYVGAITVHNSLRKSLDVGKRVCATKGNI